jgi:hypothetical protein
MQNKSSPTDFFLAEGSSQFTIQNKTMANTNKLYDFYIVATANGGAVLYQHAYI